MLLDQHAVDKPIRSLVILFTLWKGFLLLVALVSLVGPAYDTSASILDGPNATAPLPSLVTRLTSWDAIYFTQAARRGYVFEQEWAFGAGLPGLVSFLVRGLRYFGLGQNISVEAALGILVAHVSHLLSAIALYHLGRVLTPTQLQTFVAAALHIISPAGLFLSAPYAESTFSLLSFLGFLCLAHAVLPTSGSLARSCLILCAGASFGLATVFRSNGILNGLPFALLLLQNLWELRRDVQLTKVADALVVGVAGVLVACGTLVPQSLAYLEYCSGSAGPAVRPWCQRHVPSIYTFVQDYYWDNGFLRYWTLYNLPLFLLAAPMTFVLFKSGLETTLKPIGQSSGRSELMLVTRSAALAQFIITVLAFTNHHIQIITRLSSGYPVWYWWLASNIIDGEIMEGKYIASFMIIYASIQGVLFASFLPPA